MNKRLKLTRKFIYISALIFIVLFSVGYSALSQTLNIGGSTRYNKKYPIRVTGIQLQGTSNSGTEQFNPNYTWNTTTTGVNLPNLNSTVTYTVTVRNYGNEDKGINLNITNNSNSNMTYETSNMPTNNIIPANSTKTFNVTIKYNTSTLPGTTTDTMTITYTFGNIGAMFKTGQEVNAKMKKFVNSSATYSTSDTTITNIARYTGTPNSTYLTDTYKVSIDEYMTPIYMWYDSASTTIYWYSEATNIYYNPNSNYFFANLRAINSITCMNDISSEYTTKMSQMFSYTGYSNTAFTLDLGDKFDTSNVTNMYGMFSYTGYSSTVFTLDLGDNFDTSNVTTMSSMFNQIGYSSTVFTLDLGDKFDTSNVTGMSSMFYYTGYSSTVFTLNLGDNFDTSNVTNMAAMFDSTGYSSEVFTLDLGDKFDTSNVTDMSGMFSYTGRNSTVFTLDLGDKFDTSNVTSMSSMFEYTGRSSTAFTLDLGDNFDTSNVTDMYEMFEYTGYKSTVFTLNLGDKFDTSNVTGMFRMFNYTGYSSTSFTLDLGDRFDTSKVTNMYGMFEYTGRNSTSFTLDLGDKFDTGNVTNMYQMFSNTGYKSTVLTLDLGDKFDTGNVTNMSYMFSNTGYKSTIFTLDLGDKFDTSNVTRMDYMFSHTGYSSPVFTLDLGDKFDTSNVTNMSYMFENTGRNSTVFTLDLGNKFDTSNVTNMAWMFSNSRYLKTIYAPTTFVTTAVTNSANMFYGCTNLVGGQGTIYNSSYIDKTYAHIDGGTNNPGYFTDGSKATFKTGKEINARMKQFVNSSATYHTIDTTIKNIARYTGTPNSSYLIDANKVSITDSQYPIYMWYDSSNYTVYWYTVAKRIYYNSNSSYLYNNLRAINSLSNLNDISSKNTINMSNMFADTGYSSTVFTLDLGDKFDTSNVTNMSNMFADTGYSSPVFTLDLGDKFDTSNVTTMSQMFYSTGYSSTSFALDLGDKYDTSKVTDMNNMFFDVGYSSTVFTLNLGDKFDTSNVTRLDYMFYDVAFNNPTFQLDLGYKFDTSKVTNMSYMFFGFKGKRIYAPDLFVTTSVIYSEDMFLECNNLVGGAGTEYDSVYTDASRARIDGGTNNPGYFTATGTKTALIYYNTNTTSGGLTVRTIKTSCVASSGSTNCTITVPNEVSSSVGMYNSPFKGLSTSTGNMNDNLTISNDTTLYANYSKQVTNYYYDSSYNSRIIYRNEYFTSKNNMEAKLALSDNNTTNVSTASGPGGSVWTGLSTGQDTTVEYSSIQAAANSNTANLYTVYQFNVTYTKGSNVSSIGASSGNCKVTSNFTSCIVTLPSITPNSGYISVGWNTSIGATTGTSAGSSYTLSSNGTTLYANAKANTETITFGSCSQGPGRLQQCYVEKNVSTIKNPSSIAFTWTNATITQGGQAGDLVVYAQYYNGSSWQDFSLVGGGNYYYGLGKYVGDGVFTYTGTINAASVPSNIQKIRLGVYSNATAYPSLTVSMGSGKVVLTG